MSDDMERRLSAVEGIASAALTTAQQAQGEMTEHDRLCSERWRQAQLTMAEIKTAVGSLTGRWWAAATAAISLLVVAVVALFGKVTGFW